MVRLSKTTTILQHYTTCIRLQHTSAATAVRQHKVQQLPTIQQTRQFLFNQQQQQHKQHQPNKYTHVNHIEHHNDSIDKLSQQHTIQQQSLLDTHRRQHTYLRISLTEKCNLRCLYCMPPDGIDLTPQNHLLSTTEVQQLINLFINAGINKIRFTGGEPLIRNDIVDIIRYANQYKNIQQLHTIGITTNGIVLQRKLNDLIDAGVTHINLSLDTLQANKFEQITRRNGFKHVFNALRACIDKLNINTGATDKLHGLQQLKLNTVIMRNINDNEILDFVELTRNLPIEIRFIEYMPFDGNQWNDNKFVSYKDMLSIIRSKYNNIQQDILENNHTSKTWSVPGHIGKIGFITSMSHNFCSTCNRLRITADGQLKVCLFDNNEVSLRDVLRSDDKLYNGYNMNDIVNIAVKNKKPKHAGMFDLANNLKNRPMIKIGG